MALLQLTAAWEAGVDKLVYHTFNKEGTDAFVKAKDYFQKFAAKVDGHSHSEGLQLILSYGFKWGIGDGN
jgi:hypothetical protein